MAHRHQAARIGAPYAFSGMCGCPGCRNAFARATQTCSCGAECEICEGMGAASLRQHRAHGYSLWLMPGDHPMNGER